MIFFMGSAQMYNHIKRLTRNWTVVETSVGAAERLEEVLGKPLRDYQHTVEAIRYRPPASTEKT